VPARRARDVAGGALLAAGFRQRQVCPGLVAVAAPVLVLDLVAGLGRAGDGAVGAAFGAARLAAKSRTLTSGSWAMRGSARVRLARKVRFATINMSRNSRKKLLVTGWERSVQGRYRNSAVNGG
jgi:hypothetical protein